MRIFYSIMLLILFSPPLLAGTQKENIDTIQQIDFTHADAEFNSGNYQKASSLYLALKDSAIARYHNINSEQVEDLQKKYPISEIQLQKEIAQNRFMRVLVIALLVLSMILVFVVLFIRKQNLKFKHSQLELQKAKARAEESIRNKSLYLSNMSHEIKTPLNALSGFADLLTSDDIDDATRKQCNDIIQLNSELLIKLLNDVVDLSCIDVANMKFAIVDCEVISLCHNVVKTVSIINQLAAEILFESELDTLTIQTDADRLKQMLVNLLVNATKFTAEGSITLSVKVNQNGMAEFSVTDTGCGISLENQSKVFGRFEKLNEKAQGTGLGLSICQLIIKRMGGDIWIDPEYTAGSRFVFVHPLKQ